MSDLLRRLTALRLAQTIVCSLMLLFSPARAADNYLEPEQAFQFSASMSTPKQVTITYQIADGYYMYRERFHFKAEGAVLGQAVLPAGKVKFDETFHKEVETYRHTLQIQIPVEAAGGFTLTATGQGCADAGLCYAPMDSEIKLGQPAGFLGAARRLGADAATAKVDASPASSSLEQTKVIVPQTEAASDSGRIEGALKSGRLLVIMPLFLLLGLGLAFTPCVLPMVPILSAILAGEGAGIGRGRSFSLAMAYALGMAIVYTVLGVAAGLLGEGLAASLQNPWVLGTFALLMTGFALSMFGVYHLQMPSTIQRRLVLASDRQRAGKLAGVFIMGALSALIVGPCVAAPLAGALVYISRTHNVVVGGTALFSMAIGMSLPLLLIGLSAGSLLPRAGPWMDEVKRFFGVLMLGVALWIVSPVLPPLAQLLGWTAIGLGFGVVLLTRKTDGWLMKIVGVLFVMFGTVELIGAATGAVDPLTPLARTSSAQIKTVAFTRVRSISELDAALRANPQKTAMLDFYADWCVSCKEMEKLTFSDPQIEARLSKMVLLQADVTANSPEDKALLKRFGLFGPPGIIFFRDQAELPGTRVIGYQDSERFASSLVAVESR